MTTVLDHHWLGGEARLDEGVPDWGRGGARAQSSVGTSPSHPSRS